MATSKFPGRGSLFPPPQVIRTGGSTPIADIDLVGPFGLYLRDDLAAISNGIGFASILIPSDVVTLELINVTGLDSSLDLSGVDGLESLNLSQLVYVDGQVTIADKSALVSLDLSSLVAADGGIQITSNALTSINLGSLRFLMGELDLTSNDDLASIDISSLVETISGGIFIGSNPSLSGAINLSQLQSVDGDLAADTAPLLTSLSLSSALRYVNGNVSVSAAALDQPSIDSILVRLAALDGTAGTTSYDSHIVTLNRGRNAMPGATGRAAKDTLEARSNTVLINYEIVAVNVGAKTFTISDPDGDLDGVVGIITVTGSTANDGSYDVVSAVHGTTTTVVTVVQAIPSPVADGWVWL